jgi:hypothetical protein
MCMYVCIFTWHPHPASVFCNSISTYLKLMITTYSDLPVYFSITNHNQYQWALFRFKWIEIREALIPGFGLVCSGSDLFLHTRSVLRIQTIWELIGLYHLKKIKFYILIWAQMKIKFKLGRENKRPTDSDRKSEIGIRDFYCMFSNEIENTKFQ